MSFASTALRHRERESKTLRIFLACSLAGSLIFHLALLASGIGKYLLNRVPEVEDEPVEITLLDTPIEEIEPKEEVKPKPKPEPKKIEPKLEKLEPLPELKPEIKQPDLDSIPSQSRISGGSPTSLSQPIPTQRRITPQAPPVVKQPIPKPEIKQPEFKPFKQFKPIEPISPAPPLAVKKEPVIPEQKPKKPEPIATNDIPKPIPKPEPEIRTARDFSTPIEPPAPKADEDLEKLLAQERDSRRTARNLPNPVTPPIEPPAKNQQDSGELRDTMKGIRESRDANISSNNTAPSSPDTSNIGESSDNAPRRRRRNFGGNVASAPTNTIDTGTGNGLGSGDSVGDGDGRAACRRCDRSYPSWARNKGIEGNITVSINADAQGNVTDVQLLSGSGNSRLDDYHLELARKWKLKPSSNGRSRVTIITKYKLQ